MDRPWALCRVVLVRPSPLALWLRALLEADPACAQQVLAARGRRRKVQQCVPCPSARTSPRLTGCSTARRSLAAPSREVRRGLRVRRLHLGLHRRQVQRGRMGAADRTSLGSSHSSSRLLDLTSAMALAPVGRGRKVLCPDDQGARDLLDPLPSNRPAADARPSDSTTTASPCSTRSTRPTGRRSSSLQDRGTTFASCSTLPIAKEACARAPTSACPSGSRPATPPTVGSASCAPLPHASLASPSPGIADHR